MATSLDFDSQYESLIDFYKKRNFQKASDVFDALEPLLIRRSMMVISNSLSVDEMVVILDVLEKGAYLALFRKNTMEFERIMLSLRVYYYDIEGLPESDQKYPLMGLDLLNCLVQHRLSEFHTLLELLPIDVITTNQYIVGPVLLEQYFMEGSFQKIWEAFSTISDEEHRYFMLLMTNSLRNELLSCFEQSYLSMSLESAMKLLSLESDREFEHLINDRGWTLDKDDGKIYFNNSKVEAEEKKGLHFSPKNQLIEQYIYFANELETII